MDKETIDKYAKSIKELERNVNLRICEYCGCAHPVRLHIGHDLQITPIYQHPGNCHEYMRVMMREIRALQNRLGLPENIC